MGDKAYVSKSDISPNVGSIQFGPNGEIGKLTGAPSRPPSGIPSIVPHVTEQQLKCLRGEHERDSQSGFVEMRVGNFPASRDAVVCKHCRCLYVEAQ